MIQEYLPSEISVQERDMNPDMAREQERTNLLAHEDDILSGLMEAADFANDEEEIVPIEIIRKGKTVFTFHIHPLTEEQYNACRKSNTKYVRNKNLGVKMAEETNSARYRSCLIYEATTAEDREKIWNNKAAWKKLTVLNGPDLISKVLKAGEKDAICEKLDEISGYGATELETIKN